jgi:hypothetical protein
MHNEFTAAIEGDLYSDAMDSAVTVYCTQGYIDRNSTDTGETRMRRQLAAAIRAFLENTPESDLVRLARPPAPFRNGSTVGPQAVARISPTPK